jgi:hypothetical protein
MGEIAFECVVGIRGFSRGTTGEGGVGVVAAEGVITPAHGVHAEIFVIGFFLVVGFGGFRIRGKEFEIREGGFTVPVVAFIDGEVLTKGFISWKQI